MADGASEPLTDRDWRQIAERAFNMRGEEHRAHTAATLALVQAVDAVCMRLVDVVDRLSAMTDEEWDEQSARRLAARRPVDLDQKEDA